MRIKGLDILKSLLMTIGAAGLTMVAVTAPGLFGILDPGERKRYQPQQIKRAFEYARRSHILKLQQIPSGYRVMLTPQGQQRLREFRLGELRLPRPKSWDGKWRIVVFDVPEKYKRRRVIFSRKLRELGMCRIQKSVYVWPHPLQDEVDVMKEAYEIRPFVRMATAIHIDRQRDLLKFFQVRQ